MVELTIALVLDVVRTCGILVGIYYYLTILRNQEKNRMINMVFQSMQTRTSEYFEDVYDVVEPLFGWKTVEEFNELYNWKKTPEIIVKRSSIQNQLSAWGLLLREGLIDVDFIGRLYPPSYVITWWERNEPIYLDNRKRTNNPEYMKDLELLYQSLKKRYPNVSSKDTIYYLDETENQ
jgi:hypothetical protein